MQVNIKQLHPDSVIPAYAKHGDAGMDLTAISKEYDEHGNVVYGTGLAFEIPNGFVGLLFPRSSNTKKDLILGNSVGVIDSGYRGEVVLKFKSQLSLTEFRGAEPEEIEAGWLERRFKTSAIKTYAQYSVVEVFQNQGKITSTLLEDFTKSVEGEGFLVDSAFTSAPKGDKATNEAVQKVVQASQVLEELKIQEQQAEVKNRTRIQNENAEAEARKIRSESEAEANRIIAKSIDDTLVEYRMIEGWNGELPQVTGGANPFVELAPKAEKVVD